MSFIYSFETIEGAKDMNHKVTKECFDETKIEDEKYIKSFLKKHSNTFLKSCKILECKKCYGWYVQITVDLSNVNIKDLLNKEMDMLTLNYIVHDIDKDKYENLFNYPGKKIAELQKKYYKQGYIKYNNLKILFDKIDKKSYKIKIKEIKNTE